MVVRDVPPGATAVGIPARIIETEQAQKREEHAEKMGFSAYAVTDGSGDADDPVAQAIHGLLDHASETDRRIALLLKYIEHAGLVDPKMDEEALATADKFDPGQNKSPPLTP